ncbi:MAG: SpaA isopeptide-forming pilin-related protein [Clostridia bacterium]
MEYSVSVEEAINNVQVWRVLRNGFPYVSAAELGVENDIDAFFATKQAVYAVLDGRDTNRYSGADARGDKIVAAIKKLVNIGRNGTETPYTPVINVSKVNNAGVDKINNKYISQTFTTSTNLDAKDVEVIFNKSQAPEGTILTDINNKQKSTFKKGEQFKILVPRENITKDVNIDIRVSCNVKTYPVLFAEAPKSEWQDYAIVVDPFQLADNQVKFSYTKPTGTFELNKVSKSYNEYTKLEGGTGLAKGYFKLERIDGEKFEKTFYTNDLGKYIQELDLGKYRVTELKAPDYYQMGKEGTIFDFEINYDGQKVVITIENDNVSLETNVEKDGDTQGQGNEVINYQISNVHNSSSVHLENFKIVDTLPSEVRLQSITTGTYNEDLKYKVTYTTNKNNTKTIATNLSTTKDNTIDFTGVKLAKDEYITSFALVFDSVKSNFKSTKDLTVAAKVVEGLEVNSTFKNCVVVSGEYIDITVEDKDCTPTTVYENKVIINKTAAEDNQYTGDKAGDKISGQTFDIFNSETNEKFGSLEIVDGTGELKYLPIGKWYAVETSTIDYYVLPENNRFDFEITEKGQTVVLDIANDVVNLKVDVEKTGTVETTPNGKLEYNFDIQNKSNIEVENFVFGDILPSEIRINTLQTGTFNQENNYKVQYITNNNTNWKTVGTYKTDVNNEIKLDSESLGLAEGEYVEEFRLVFEKPVEKGFKNKGTKITATANADLINNQIFSNKTYVNATYLDVDLSDRDEFHTIVRIPETTKLTGTLPKTGK